MNTKQYTKYTFSVVINLYFLCSKRKETKQNRRSMFLFRVKPLLTLIAAWTFVPVVRGGGYYHDSLSFSSDSHDSTSSDSHDYCDTIGTFKN